MQTLHLRTKETKSHLHGAFIPVRKRVNKYHKQKYTLFSMLKSAMKRIETGKGARESWDWSGWELKIGEIREGLMKM